MIQVAETLLKNHQILNIFQVNEDSFRLDFETKDEKGNLQEVLRYEASKKDLLDYLNTSDSLDAITKNLDHKELNIPDRDWDRIYTSILRGYYIPELYKGNSAGNLAFYVGNIYFTESSGVIRTLEIHIWRTHQDEKTYLSGISFTDKIKNQTIAADVNVNTLFRILNYTANFNPNFNLFNLLIQEIQRESKILIDTDFERVITDIAILLLEGKATGDIPEEFSIENLKKEEEKK